MIIVYSVVTQLLYLKSHQEKLEVKGVLRKRVIVMEIDFVKIKSLRKEIDDLLNERPEYREWFENVQKQVAKGGNKHNRMVIAFQLMNEKTLELLDKIKEIKELSNKE
jgi:hypothetical protein